MTELVFILDRSGSMSGLESDTIGGFNSMIAQQKKEAGIPPLPASAWRSPQCFPSSQPRCGAWSCKGECEKHLVNGNHGRRITVLFVQSANSLCRRMVIQ